MPNSRSKTGKPSPFILYLLAFILTLFFSLSWVNAEESKKPKPEPWQIDGIIAALDDGRDKVKEYALKKLADYNQNSLGNQRDDIAEKAAKILKDKEVSANVRGSAAIALEKIRQLDLKEVVVILNYVYEPNQGDISSEGVFEYWRFFTYFLGGGTHEINTLLKWLGRPQDTPDKLTRQEGVTTLKVFDKAWQNSQDLEPLQEDLARKIADVAKKVSDWKAQDITLLQNQYKNLKGRYNEADTVHSVINNLEFWKWFFLVSKILFVHLSIWLILILAYPKFPQILSTLFWNPWLRLIFGLGYIGFLLAVIPFLRQRLFEPFKSFLLADAGLNHFDDQAYFPETMVRVRGLEENRAITEVLPSLKGQIILQGDSGLGAICLASL